MAAPLSYRDLSGDRIGKLLVMRPTPERKGGSVVWECRCDCGNTKMVARPDLIRGGVKSCGCMKVGSPPRHGHASQPTATYRSWRAMMARCYNKRAAHYESYGGSGISVCERWHDFGGFYADMGDRPSGKTLDRFPNNNGNYEPGNCRWATGTEQNVNRSVAVNVFAFGQTKNLKEWTHELGVSYSMVQKRLARGWTPERALSAPSWRTQWH